MIRSPISGFHARMDAGGENANHAQRHRERQSCILNSYLQTRRRLFRGGREKNSQRFDGRSQSTVGSRLPGWLERSCSLLLHKMEPTSTTTSMKGDANGDEIRDADSRPRRPSTNQHVIILPASRNNLHWQCYIRVATMFPLGRSRCRRNTGLVRKRARYVSSSWLTRGPHCCALL